MQTVQTISAHQNSPTQSSGTVSSPQLFPSFSEVEDMDVDVDVDVEDSHQFGKSKKATKGQKRGGYPPQRQKVNKKGKKVFQEGQSLGVSVSNEANSFIAVVASARWGSETHDVAQWLENIRDGFIQQQNLQADESSESLASLVQRCNLSQAAGIRESFFNMVNSIRLAAKCQR
jgi:hypothetical protein